MKVPGVPSPPAAASAFLEAVQNKANTALSASSSKRGLFVHNVAASVAEELGLITPRAEEQPDGQDLWRVLRVLCPAPITVAEAARQTQQRRKKLIYGMNLRKIQLYLNAKCEERVLLKFQERIGDSHTVQVTGIDFLPPATLERRATPQMHTTRSEYWIGTTASWGELTNWGSVVATRGLAQG